MIPQVFLKQPPQGVSRPGHPWIYASQLELRGVEMAPGTLVDVMTGKGRFVGRGYFNGASQIAVRLLSRDAVPVDKAFFRERIDRAAELRRRFVRETDAYRLVSSEADGLPGLIVDRYGEVLVAQFLTAGMEAMRDGILEALSEATPSRGIYERSDSSGRRVEGLPDRSGWIEKSCGDAVEFHERDLRYRIQFGEGHKTGTYLDQRENRFYLRDLGIKGKVLDAFCYEGGFGLHLARSGAHVTGIDIQKANLERARGHRDLNGIPASLLDFREADVFEELKELEKKKERFDLVILDPPSFAKNKAALDGALAGFKEISLRGMKILAPGGLLALFSCSFHVDEEKLLETALQAASDLRKDLVVVHRFVQSADHPVLAAVPETRYLKGFLFQVS